MRISLVLMLSAVAAFGNDFDHRLCGHDLPGHLVKNHCYAYAVNLKEEMDARDIPAVWVGYAWRNGTRHDNHLGVVFEYHGKLWWMDNLRMSPALVRGDTDFSAMQNLSDSRRVISITDNATGAHRPPQRLEALVAEARKLTVFRRDARVSP